MRRELCKDNGLRRESEGADTPGSADAKWRSFAQAGLPAILFLAIFAAAIYAVEWLGRSGPLDSYTMRIAAAGAAILRVFRVDAQAQGTRLVISQGGGVTVGWQCSGLSLAVPVAAFFLAFPAPWRRRLLAATIAFVAVQVVNVFRVTALALIAERAREYLVLSHDTLWNAFVIAVVLLVWIAWSGRRQSEESGLDQAS